MLKDLLPATTGAEARERRDVLCQALESGKYTQTVRALKTEYGYCCQGVACDLLRTEWMYDDAEGMYSPVEFPYRVTWPDAVRRYYGITRRDSDRLAGMNDKGYSFGQIASTIRTLPVEV